MRSIKTPAILKCQQFKDNKSDKTEFKISKRQYIDVYDNKEGQRLDEYENKSEDKSNKYISFFLLFLLLKSS